MTDWRPTVLIIAKEPIPGRVKTRLCPPCTPIQAAAIARAAIADTVAAVTAIDGIRPLLVLDGRSGPWLDVEIPTVAQTGDAFDERLAAAFTHAAGPAVLIGMDTPQITSKQIRQAVTTLQHPEVDAVLGRTDDGGWWIIGFDRPAPGAFHDVPMSTPITGARQLARLDALALRTALLPSTTDVDTFADALRVAEAHPSLAFAREVRSVAAAQLQVGVPV
jgi:rSAM/selenodomain-associated transferase 1